MSSEQQQHHHHHHHHHKDGASRFKERSLNAIVIRKRLEKWGKIVLAILALLMIIALFTVYAL